MTPTLAAAAGTPEPARALIAEDEPLLAQGLRAELQRLWPGLEIVAQVGDGESAVQQALALAPQVCFLDIRMPGLSGLEAAQALAEDWPDGDAAPPFPLLVFVTAYDQYAVQAFERQAVDYLLKPVDGVRLGLTVQRLQAQLAERRATRQATPAADSTALQAAVAQLRALLGSVALPSPPAAAVTTQTQPRLDVIQAGVGATVHLVPVDEVLYFEAADKYVRVITAERELLIRMSLKELLPQLDPQRFWQIHRGTIVQSRAIAKAEREESGKVTLTLHQRPDKLTASRLYAHLFRGM